MPRTGKSTETKISGCQGLGERDGKMRSECSCIRGDENVLASESGDMGTVL